MSLGEISGFQSITMLMSWPSLVTWFFFLDPPARWRPGHLFLQGTSRKKIDKNLTVLAFRNALPTRPFRKLSTCINDFLNSKKLNLFIKAIDSPNDVVIWQFDYLRFVFFPKKWNLQKDLSCSRSIYGNMARHTFIKENGFNSLY